MRSSRPLRQIVAMGGGGFSMEPRNPRLDRFILSLSRKRNPRVCFVPTASGDSRDYIRRFHLAFKKFRCRRGELTLFRRDQLDLRKFILEQDVLYVGGGNTANMLMLWRFYGVDRFIREAWTRGTVLCGVSAGMNCWFESSVTDSFGPLKELKDGMGFLPGSACPHYDGEAKRRPMFHRLVREKILPAGVAADDGAAIHFVGTKIARCVSSRPGASAYRIERIGGKIREMPLPTVFLGG